MSITNCLNCHRSICRAL